MGICVPKLLQPIDNQQTKGSNFEKKFPKYLTT